MSGSFLDILLSYLYTERKGKERKGKEIEERSLISLHLVRHRLLLSEYSSTVLLLLQIRWFVCQFWGFFFVMFS